MATVGAAFLLACGSEPPPVLYDLASGFSLMSNPSGVWEYGYSAGSTLTMDQFRLDMFADPKTPIGFWHPDNPAVGYYPYIAHNSDAVTHQDPTASWAVRPEELALEASNVGQFGWIRFVAPTAGSYQINTRFAGIHFRLSSTDVHVLHNEVELFSADIQGYGGDPAFLAVQGAQPTALYTGSLTLQAGDRISFAVGYGPDQTNYDDTTGVFAQITYTPGR
jgi:hypothetical protein